MPASNVEAHPGRVMWKNTCSTLRIGDKTITGLNLTYTAINVPTPLWLILFFTSL